MQLLLRWPVFEEMKMARFIETRIQGDLTGRTVAVNLDQISSMSQGHFGTRIVLRNGQVIHSADSYTSLMTKISNAGKK
jgi:hypothetical protein